MDNNPDKTGHDHIMRGDKVIHSETIKKGFHLIGPEEQQAFVSTLRAISHLLGNDEDSSIRDNCKGMRLKDLAEELIPTNYEDPF